MPMHNDLIPREGFKIDVILRFFSSTVFNPAFTLPILLLANLTNKGENLSILHYSAFSCVKFLLCLGLIRWLNSWYSRGAINNWQDDQYEWQAKEVVLITGGSCGIGAHVVKLLSEMGIKVVVLDIQPLTFESSSKVHYFKCDITSKQQIAAVAEQVRSKVGHPTVLINNAGVVRGKTILDSSEKDIRFTFDVNALAHYWTVQEFLPNIIKNNHGMVVTVSSITAWVTMPNMVDYAASKHASLAFHEGLTAELVTRYGADKVRTVVVNQGYTRTPLFEGSHNDFPFLLPSLEPETVAEAIVRQVLTGKSGQVIAPALATLLSAFASLPLWCQHRIRKDGSRVMRNWQGRQVVPDLDTFYREKEEEVEGSIVMVSEVSNGRSDIPPQGAPIPDEL
ncbi:Short-chain dehydrogenase/reductase family 16C member 6 [Cytospora mali]|uniref:Short-chain dehydrogenase/reductase 3 n=1 Tax=Cytospora mali TaxID=578113 RepID=A0A194VVC5_CYTMA|nr:Short-chain dehydrogenase/reductase family 16C member 6 [Valsa mali]